MLLPFLANNLLAVSGVVLNTPTPPGRQIIVEHDDRDVVVASENRSIIVEYDDRTVEVNRE
jgi:hypothetical protein